MKGWLQWKRGWSHLVDERMASSVLAMNGWLEWKRGFSPSYRWKNPPPRRVDESAACFIFSMKGWLAPPLQWKGGCNESARCTHLADESTAGFFLAMKGWLQWNRGWPSLGDERMAYKYKPLLVYDTSEFHAKSPGKIFLMKSCHRNRKLFLRNGVGTGYLKEVTCI